MIGADQFREFAAKHGYELPTIIEPGKFIRFQTNGRHGDSAGWARLFEDCKGGIVGDWRTGISEVWQAKRDRQPTPEEKRAWNAKIEQQKREAKAQREREENEAAARAKAIWEASPIAPADHPYLKAKQVPPLGLKLYRGPELVIGGVDVRGALIMPFRNATGELRSLEFIDADGVKRFLPGASYKGAYMALAKAGEKRGDVICICEGAATALSIHTRARVPVRATGAAGNLLAVAQALRSRLQTAKIILCADNDAETSANSGVTSATEAARAVGGFLAIPEAIDGKATDFNDLANKLGADALKAAIAEAKVVPQTAALSPKSNGGEPGVSELVTRCFADIEPEPINWLWPDNVARGKLTVIAGDPGFGKSQLSVSIAAIVTKGGRWPVDRTPCERGRVIFLSAEDDPADTIRPRLDAAGADVALCEIIQFVRCEAKEGTGPTRRAFSLKADMLRLSELLAKRGDVALVIIDPVTAYMGDADTHRNSDVRSILAEVSEVARKHKAAFIAISHLNKGDSAKALQRVTGSLAFVAAARAAFLVAEDRDTEGQRLFIPMKNNIGPDSTGYAFRIEPAEFPGRIRTSRIIWAGDRVAITADEALTQEGEAGGKSELEAAKQFLQAELADGPVSAKAIERDAHGNGLAWATVRRAKAALGVGSEKSGMERGWQWKLAPKMLKNAEDAQAQDVSTFGKNEHLREPEARTPEPEAEQF